MTDRNVRWTVGIVMAVLVLRLLDAAFTSGMWLEFSLSVGVLVVSALTILLVLKDQRS